MASSSIPITPWPATPLLPPALVNRTAWDFSSAAVANELPDQWVLQCLDRADLEDDDEIEKLLAEYGRISWPYSDPGMVPLTRRPFLAPSSAASEEDIDSLGQRHDGTLEDARWWLKTARALVSMWRNVNFGINPGDAWAAEGFLSVDEPAAWAAEGFLSVDEPAAWAAEGFLSVDEPAAWVLFTVYLNAGLEPFRARVYWSQTTRDGVAPVELYTAACQQFFNYLVTGATPRRCENTRCGRLFVHQIGGPVKWHRSEGLKYCRPSCAQAENQRQYRRRKKEQKS